MTDTLDLEPILRDHFGSNADASVPAYQVAEVLRAASRMPQRAARTWAPTWWGERPHMHRRRGLAIGLLLLALAVGAAIAGSAVLRVPALVLPSYRGVFESLGSVPVDEDPSTLTALADGRALITSGKDLVLFDPGTDGFVSGGQLGIQRDHPIGVLLADGRVLVTGGERTSAGVTRWFDPTDRRAEVFDPRTGAVGFTGRPAFPVNAAPGTLLADGRVLFAGGEADGAVADAQLYDPVTGRFTRTGAMSRPRSYHGATLLRDGRVLIVGGGGADGRPDAEIYDPASGTFSMAGPMIVPVMQGFVLSSLPDGRVLVAGGWRWISDEDSALTDAAQIFDPVTGGFTLTGSLPSPRSELAAATLADGRLLLMGGRAQTTRSDGTQGWTPLDDAETYDPRSGAFVPTGHLDVPRMNALATTLADGSVLVVGHTCLVNDPVCDPPDERRFAHAEIYR